MDAMEKPVRCTVNGRRMTLSGHPDVAPARRAPRRRASPARRRGAAKGSAAPARVLLDGALVNACLTPLAHAEGATITTIEGLAGDRTLHAVQTAFLECGGAQCGICTPGMVLAACDLLSRNSDPTEADVRAALAGNLCRCTGYMRIFEAVLDASRRLP